MNIRFEKAGVGHLETIFQWLSEPHMMDFWDNSQEHKDDIINFVHGKKQRYFYGTTKYWVGYFDNNPYCFLLSDILLPEQELADVQRIQMSPQGHTISLDFGIGNKEYLGKGLAAPTLEAFVRFYKESVDVLADTFFIEPATNNPRAKRVYAKAGFQEIGQFEMEKGAFAGSPTILMVKRMNEP